MTITAAPLDALMAQLVLEAVKPAALEVSLRVAEDLEAEHADTHRLWLQRLERARYEAERAFRQYDAVEPENRLVGRMINRHGQFLARALEQVGSPDDIRNHPANEYVERFVVRRADLPR